MSDTAKTAWVDALTSGEYNQTQFTLHDYRGYCCLGVLCDVYAKQHPERDIAWVSVSHGDYYKYTVEQEEDTFDYCNTPPTEVSEWAGLSHIDLVRLVWLNDTRRIPFTQLAEWVATNTLQEMYTLEVAQREQQRTNA